MGKDAHRLVAGAAVGFFGSMYVLRFLRWLAEGPAADEVTSTGLVRTPEGRLYRDTKAYGRVEAGTLESAFAAQADKREPGFEERQLTPEYKEKLRLIQENPPSTGFIDRADQPVGVLLPARRGGQPVFRR